MEALICIQEESSDADLSESGLKDQMAHLGVEKFHFLRFTRNQSNSQILSEVIETANQLEVDWILCSLSSFSSQIEELAALTTFEGEVRFFDFYPKRSIDLQLIMDLKKFFDQQRSNRIKTGISKARCSGSLIGNPNFYDEASKAKLKEDRRRAKVYDLHNIAIRKRINDLAVQGMNYSQIARKLNEEGLKTRRNREFLPITVSRFAKDQKEINEKFEVNNFRTARQKSGAQASTERDFPDLLSPIKDVSTDKTLLIELKGSPNESWSVEVRDYSVRKKVYEKSFAPTLTRVELNIEKELRLLPGLYYCQINSQGKTHYNVSFYVRKDLFLPFTKK